MTIAHHPTDMTLAAFAAGTLDEGQSLVVATHLSLCPACRRGTRTFEAAAGTLLDDLPGTPLGPGALSQALAALTAPPEQRRPQPRPQALDDPLYPPPLSPYHAGPWRHVGIGVAFRSIAMSAEGGSRVIMLKAAPGARLPYHAHTGIEWTCVLKGAFVHDGGHFGAGDFDEADAEVEHRPRVEPGVECICLVALQGQILFRGPIGRLLQPFVRL
jgi:putative transcriptional regulator